MKADAKIGDEVVLGSHYGRFIVRKIEGYIATVQLFGDDKESGGRVYLDHFEQVPLSALIRISESDLR